MRYFEIDEKPCRALPFNAKLYFDNIEAFLDQNVFVELPKTILHKDLEEIFSDCGKIKSLKVSLDSNYSSRGYGFICFENKASAWNALNFIKPGIKVQPLKRKAYH